MLTQRTIIITGASSGIGKETAVQLLNAGHRVVGMARDFTKSGVQSREFHNVSIDFADSGACEASLKQLAKTITGITDIVCCAGAGRFGSLEEFSFNQIRELMDINFVSQACVVRAFLPQLKQHGRGNIVFVGSEAALTGSRRGSVYCASKFAVRGFAQALREECGGNGIRVGIVNPGMVKTPFFDRLDFTHGESTENYIEPADVASAIIWILNSRAETVIDEINLSPLKKVITKKPVT
ncbi:MAG: SDR family NAD(P)-dependent oxidoreductase [Gammaproteobacteria bacterium]|nr:SDR family NAD(P)-dependent oxidoreductase [Gammaproteobacteria bacterium]